MLIKIAKFVLSFVVCLDFVVRRWSDYNCFAFLNAFNWFFSLSFVQWFSVSSFGCEFHFPACHCHSICQRIFHVISRVRKFPFVSFGYIFIEWRFHNRQFEKKKKWMNAKRTNRRHRRHGEFRFEFSSDQYLKFIFFACVDEQTCSARRRRLWRIVAPMNTYNNEIDRWTENDVFASIFVFKHFFRSHARLWKNGKWLATSRRAGNNEWRKANRGTRTKRKSCFWPSKS